MNAIEFSQTCVEKGIDLFTDGQILSYEADSLKPQTLAYMMANKLPIMGALILGEMAIKKAADDDLETMQKNPDIMNSFIHGLIHTHLMGKGKVPPDMTKAVNCQQCGGVWLEDTAPDSVLTCQWCHHRINGVVIPQPSEDDPKNRR